MQKRPSVLIIVTVIIHLLFAAKNFCAAGTIGPEEMELKTAAGTKPARFPHKKHQEKFRCKECHHAQTGKDIKSPYIGGMEVQKCSNCHNAEAMSNAKLNSFKLAAHTQCKECHKKYKDSAPTRCSGCHIKM
jgi:hypothetical protein